MAKPKSNFSTIKVKDNRYITIYFRNTHFRSGYQISELSDFNKTTGKFSPNWKKENKGAIESIESFKLKIDTLIKKAREEGVNELGYIKEKLKQDNSNYKKVKISKHQKPSIVYEDYISSEIDSRLMRPNSKIRFFTNLNKLRWFEENDKTTLAEIDMKYINNFIKWMSEEKVYIQKVEKDKKWGRKFEAPKNVQNTNSTIKRWLGDFCSFLLWAEENDKKLNFPIKKIRELSGKLKTSKDSQEIIALTPKQWKALKNFQLPEHLKGIESSLDAFIFCCNCGLRSSDLRRLNSAHIMEDGRTISMTASKTTHKFWVKMNTNAYSIFLKYDKDFRGKFPTVQRLSINLRKILKEIEEFKHDDIKIEYHLLDVVEKPVKNYEKFSFHASRRTFVTNCMRAGIKLVNIKKYTGWSSIRQLQEYLDYINTDNNEDYLLEF